jgi:hypothetical protein
MENAQVASPPAEGQTQVQEQPQISAAKAKSKTKLTGDVFTETAHEVENLTKGKALALAEQLVTNVDVNYFKLGGVLKVIHENGWFEGFETFESYVFEKFGFQKRKAFYLVQIYSDLVGKSIPYEKIAHLGWTKIKDLSPVLTLDNLEEWIAKAETASVAELQAILKTKGPGGEAPDVKDEIQTLKFKVHGDQAQTISSALNKAKAEAKTDFDTVALEMICTGYLGGSSPTPTLDANKLGEQFQKLGIEVVFNAVEVAFPNLKVTVEEVE